MKLLSKSKLIQRNISKTTEIPCYDKTWLTKISPFYGYEIHVISLTGNDRKSFLKDVLFWASTVGPDIADYVPIFPFTPFLPKPTASSNNTFFCHRIICTHFPFRQARYCGVECQMKHWKNSHMHNCKLAWQTSGNVDGNSNTLW